MCHRRLRTRLSHCRPTGAVSRLFSPATSVPGRPQPAGPTPTSGLSPCRAGRSQAADSSEKDFSYARPYPACPALLLPTAAIAARAADRRPGLVRPRRLRPAHRTQPARTDARPPGRRPGAPRVVAFRTWRRPGAVADQRVRRVCRADLPAARRWRRIAPLAQWRGGAGVAQRHRRQRHAALRQVALGAPSGAHARLAGQALGEFQRDARPPRTPGRAHGATGLATLVAQVAAALGERPLARRRGSTPPPVRDESPNPINRLSRLPSVR
ncbi:hypothetical protein PACG_01341 [Pseudomonas aeruginosa C3719]|nr:hypothetical protein PACG_01341 [Pseudomonas aeruginosa C3719]